MKSAAVLYVRDLSLMRSFYAACFTMNIGDNAEGFCVLESDPFSLSLVTVPEHIRGAIVRSVPPTRREDVPIKLAFTVDSIEILRPVFAEFGGVVDPVTSQWEFRGRVHCDAVDPEGNVIQLVQPFA